eukprot:COSAG04_NODE_2456_length_4092_cov_3.629101_2_plen_306_part_00
MFGVADDSFDCTNGHPTHPDPNAKLGAGFTSMGWGLYNFNGASYHDTKGAGTRGHEAWKVVPNVATNGVSLRFELDCNAGTMNVWKNGAPMGQMCSGVSGTVRWMIMLSHPDAAARVVSVQGEESQQKFYRHKLGALGGGNDLASGDYTVDEACKFCLTLPHCVGFTYMGELNPPGRVRCYFKSTQAGNDDPAWQTHLLHFTHKVGALGAGNDVESGQYTLEEAYVRCSMLQAAVGFTYQVIPPIGAEGLSRRPPAGSCRLFLGPGFRLAALWNRLVETVKTRKKREKTGEKWARYGLKGVKDGS